MKLKDVKDRIDNYFDNISAEELYEISVRKYGFRDASSDVVNETFETSEVSTYDCSNCVVATPSEPCGVNELALAA